MTMDDGAAIDAAATEWLALVDAGDSQRAWDVSGTVFRDALTAADWGNQLRSARGPLGVLTSRALAVEQRLDGIPGAAPGEYDVRQYHSVYGGVKAVVETLTLLREGDAWRVVGYFIR